MKFRLPLVSNRFLIPSKSKKNASLRLPAKNLMVPDCHDIGLGSEGDFAVRDDFLPDRFRRARLRPLRHEYVNGLPAVLRLREHIAERDVRQVIAIVIDVEAIDCVGMECVRIGICIEDDHGSILVSGRLECVQIAEVESLIAQRRAKTESSEMV